ncbi:MAG: ExeA family protein [bacterium]
MYLEYWGLKKHAFHNVPDPSMYFEMHQSVENAVAEILFAIEEGDECLAVIVGEVGLGKTMTLRVVLDTLDTDNYDIAFITNPDLTFPQILREIIGQLTNSQCEIKAKDKLLEAFNRILVESNRQNKKVLIFIDEGNAIRKVNLESLRLLTNLQADDHNLFTIVLAGQPELAERLEHPSMANLFQRIGVYCKLVKLGSKEIMRDYIEHRCEIAGATRPIFTEDAFEHVWQHSNEGVPRLVNRICKLAMKAGETNRLEIIDGTVIDAISARFSKFTQQSHQFRPAHKAPETQSSQSDATAPTSTAADHGKRPVTVVEAPKPAFEAATAKTHRIPGLLGGVLDTLTDKFAKSSRNNPTLNHPQDGDDASTDVTVVDAPIAVQKQQSGRNKRIVNNYVENDEASEFSKEVIDMMKDRYRDKRNVGILY